MEGGFLGVSLGLPEAPLSLILSFFVSCFFMPRSFLCFFCMYYMFPFVCVFLCLYARVHVFVLFVFFCVCMHVCIYLFHVFVYACIYVRAYVCARTRRCTSLLLC